MELGRAYVDSSVIVRRLLRHSAALTGLAHWNLVASELMEVEVLRALYRIHAEGFLTHEELGARIAELQAIVAAVDQVPITKLVLKRAGGPLAGILKTLDAIHLVTALLWSEYNGEAIILLTHDRQLATVARASGLQVHPWPLGA
jgi:predicted nucleic acid-binding protein